MNTPTKEAGAHSAQYKTPQKSGGRLKKSLKAVENIMTSDTDEFENNSKKDSGTVVVVLSSSEEPQGPDTPTRKSLRRPSPTKKYQQFQKEKKGIQGNDGGAAAVGDTATEDEDKDEAEEVASLKPADDILVLLQEDSDAMAGKNMFGFNTPKKRHAMAALAAQTPKTPRTPKTPKTPRTQAKTPDTKRHRSMAAEPKTPSHVRHRVRNQIAKLVEANSDTDFSADESDFEPTTDSSDSSSNDEDTTSDRESAADDEPKTPHKTRRPIVVPVLPKTPSAARLRQTARAKKSAEYVPESDGYFQTHSNKVLTSDHTLDRLRQPRLPADRLFSLLAEMTVSSEHQTAINAIMDEYRSYFTKWMCILNEGYNLLLYGLGSKRQLLQSFHRDVLAQQPVLVVNGFFPSLTLKDILDSITSDILDAGFSPSNPHDAVDMIEEEFSLIPDTHLYLIVHNLDGTMLRNGKTQSILARLAKVPNIHLLASIDHINTPLLWDHTKLSHYNFSWWDCTSMLPYTDETAFENSLLVQNSGELALSSMRSVFSSLTTNTRGIYMLIVKHQLTNKTNPNYQGMPFKDLYWSCREAFLVSSDLALRAQLTEFLDHKLVKSKRSADGSEQLTIPIDAGLLQQFLDEHEKK